MFPDVFHLCLYVNHNCSLNDNLSLLEKKGDQRIKYRFFMDFCVCNCLGHVLNSFLHGNLDQLELDNAGLVECDPCDFQFYLLHCSN